MSQVIPLTGAISLTLIDQLSGDGPGSTVTVPAPFHLSTFGGQDVTIPVAPNPLKYSDFRGAINYDNFSITLTNLSYSSVTSSYRQIHYKQNNHVYANPYSVVFLGDVSPDMVFKTRTSTVPHTTSFVQQNATIEVSMYGYLDDSVTLWMQISDESHQQVTTIANSTTVTLSSNSLEAVLTELNLNNNTIAPQLIKTVLGATTPDPFLPNTSNKVAFINQSNTLLSQLANYSNSLSPTTQYTANLIIDKANVAKIIMQKNNYNYTTVPLCYGVCTARHPSRKQGWASASVTFNLSQYPVKQGDYLKFYIGPGPTAPRQGSIWDSFQLTTTVTNPPRIVFS